MRLLITGGCGFLGSNLASAALTRGDTLIVFDNLGRMGSAENLQWLRGQGEFRHVHGDIRNAEDVARAVAEAKPDFVFHLAGQVAMITSIESPRMDFEVNALGTINLLEAVRRHAPDAGIIYSSTNKVYGDLEQYAYRETDTRFECTDRPQGFDETTPLEFQSPYGCSKGAADQYVLDYARIFGLKTTVLRHSSMYGGRQFATADQGWIGWFCDCAVTQKADPESEPFTISGTGKQVRDVLHADDMITLYFSLTENLDWTKGEVFNVGGGMENSLSLLELFAFLEEQCSIELRYTHLEARASDQRVFVADIKKLRDRIGWSPQVNYRKGIVRMLDWTESRRTAS